jgi:hypothetical protein
MEQQPIPKKKGFDLHFVKGQTKEYFLLLAIGILLGFVLKG